MEIVVVGGSASNVGKTTLATRLVRERSAHAPTVAMKVSVHDEPCETRVRTLRSGDEPERRYDTGRLLDAGADGVVWVSVNRAFVRTGLALGMRAVRNLHPAAVVVDSTSAGIELRRVTDSWFVTGVGEWKTWADRHRSRAHHVVSMEEVAYRSLS